LAQYPEWQTLSHHVQWEYIAKAMANRKTQLMRKWAEAINFMDQSEIPDLKKNIVDSIFAQIRTLSEEKERLYLEYSQFTD
jgi:hypothetical protein